MGPSMDFEAYPDIDIGLGFDFEKFLMTLKAIDYSAIPISLLKSFL